MTVDHSWLIELLKDHYPGLKIEGIAKASGQRTVFFSSFQDFVRLEPEEGEETHYKWSSWGEVVLKVSNGSNPVAVARSQQEIGVLMDMNSAYYPTLFHHELLTFDPKTETPLKQKLYITIESRIPGQPLSELLGDFSTEQAVIRLLLSLIDGLKELWTHKNQYVHRDVKPENILIQPDGQVVIIDLGIMRETGVSGITATGFHAGPCTPAFASPEQAKNDKLAISYKSDYFSLGTLAYTLLLGRNPFVTSGNITDVEILANVITLAPEPIHKIVRVSSNLSIIINKLMEKEPYKRYRQTSRLVADLKLLEAP